MRPLLACFGLVTAVVLVSPPHCSAAQGGSTDSPSQQQEGACCFADGSCLVLTLDRCDAAGGRYQGDATPCEPNPCPQPGACCLPDGSCIIIPEPDCADAHGTFNGPGTTCEEETPCAPDPLGICCAIWGGCFISTEDECYDDDEDNLWLPIGACDRDCAPAGACCFEDGTCQLRFETDCEAQGGFFQGDEVACGDVSCAPVPTLPSSWGRIRAMNR